MKIVLDANVVVAAFAARGLCESLLECCLHSHEIVVSEHLLEEIESNLVKKIKLPVAAAAQITALLRDQGSFHVPRDVGRSHCRDVDDLKILGLASAGQVDYIVTGDKDLLILQKFESIPIISPRAFSDILHNFANPRVD